MNTSLVFLLSIFVSTHTMDLKKYEKHSHFQITGFYVNRGKDCEDSSSESKNSLSINSFETSMSLIGSSNTTSSSIDSVSDSDDDSANNSFATLKKKYMESETLSIEFLYSLILCQEGLIKDLQRDNNNLKRKLSFFEVSLDDVNGQIDKNTSDIYALKKDFSTVSNLPTLKEEFEEKRTPQRKKGDRSLKRSRSHVILPKPSIAGSVEKDHDGIEYELNKKGKKKKKLLRVKSGRSSKKIKKHDWYY